MRTWIQTETTPRLYSAKIKLLTSCNLDCSFCPWRVSARATRQILSLDDLREPIRELKEFGVVGIHFSGGEPLIHPELAEIISYCRQVGIPRVSLTTNGTLATLALGRRLYAAGLRFVNVSVDGEASELHGYDPRFFDRALEGVCNLLAVRDEAADGGRLKVRVNMIVANTNLLALPGLINEFHSLGVDGLHLIPIQENEPLLLSAGQISWFRDNVLPLYRSCFDPEGRERDPFDDPGAIDGEYVREYYQKNPCYVPYVHTFVRANGDVHICCQRQIRDAPLGNILTTPLREILVGRPYREERRRTDRKACRICNMFIGFNKELERQLSPAPAPPNGAGRAAQPEEYREA